MWPSLLRLLRRRGEGSLRERTDRFRDEADRENPNYRSAVLTWGQATSPEFRLVAYGSLVDLAESLVLELRGTKGGLQPRDQFDLAPEIQVLEHSPHPRPANTPPPPPTPRAPPPPPP